MEWLDGEDLSHRLRRAEPMSVGQILDLVIQVADALAFAHARGIVHRDAMPASFPSRNGYRTEPGKGRENRFDGNVSLQTA
jgi:serine/threonine-protein kinase